MKIRLLALLVAPILSAEVAFVTSESSTVDLSTRQECEVAIARGCTWLRAQTNAAALASAIEQTLLLPPLPPKDEEPGTTADRLIVSQRRDAASGGGYWNGPDGRPSITNTVRNLFILKTL
ncbi:MAG: hypothetical protein ACI4X9_06055 [Kiritimatiellia bacterium]